MRVSCSISASGRARRGGLGGLPAEPKEDRQQVWTLPLWERSCCERGRGSLARRVRALQTVERMFALGMPSADVSVLQRPALDVAVIRDTSTLQRIAATTSACVTGLLRAFEAAGVELTGPIVGIFPLDLPDELPVVAAAETERPIPGTMPDVLPGPTPCMDWASPARVSPGPGAPREHRDLGRRRWPIDRPGPAIRRAVRDASDGGSVVGGRRPATLRRATG